MAKVIIDLEDLNQLRNFEQLKSEKQELLLKNKAMHKSLLSIYRSMVSLQLEVKQLTEELQKYKNKTFWQRITNT